MKKLSTFAAVLLASATLGGAVAYAEGTDDFAMADGNKDKAVSFDEARGAFPTLDQNVFNSVDTDQNGTLDETEFGSLKGLTAGTQSGSGNNSSSAQGSSDNNSSSAQGSSGDNSSQSSSGSSQASAQ